MDDHSSAAEKLSKMESHLSLRGQLRPWFQLDVDCEVYIPRIRLDCCRTTNFEQCLV